MKIWPTKRVWIRMAVGGALVVAALLIANGVLAWRSNRKIESLRSAIRAAGHPASIAELAPKPVPDEANAAVHLRRIEPQLEAFTKQHMEFYKSAPGNTWSQRQDAGQLPTPEQAAAMQAILDAHSEVLSGFERAAACEEYASLLDFGKSHGDFLQSLLDHQWGVRTVARFVDWKIAVLLAEGKAEEATRLGTQLLKLGRLYQSEPTLVNFLISVAVRAVAADILNRAIRTGEVTDDVRRRLIAELELQSRPALAGALQTEWALVLDFPAQATSRVPAPLRWPINNWVMGEYADLEAAIADADRPYYELKQKWSAAEATMKSTSLISPSFKAASKSEARRQVSVRCLRILLALQEFERANGKPAGGLTDLELPVEVTTDPFTGQSIKLKHTAAGWVLYSVFENGVDDEGDFTDSKDWGIAPPGWRPAE